MFRRILPLLLVITVAGCVSKSEHENVQAQLDECRRDKEAAQAAAASCQERFEEQSGRWESIGTSVEEAFPRTLQEFRAERQKIIEMVPDQVRKEVDDYLDNFADAVSKSFAVMRQDNQKVMAELEGTKTRLEILSETTGSIDERVGRRLEAADAARRGMVDDANALIALIQEWDQNYVNDKESDLKLGLNRKERETITAFHADLVTRLNALATAEAPAEAAPPASPDA